jgi:hypothetical protein
MERRRIDLPELAVEALRTHRAATRAEGEGNVPLVFYPHHAGTGRFVGSDE